MAELTDAMKEAIVRRLARYEAPTEVAKAVGEEFGVSIDRFQVKAYNPLIASFEGSQKWVYIFDEERKRWTDELDRHDITKMGYRLARLQRMSEAAERAGNFVLAAALLKQAAEDHGGSYKGSREVHHTGAIGIRADLSAAEARLELERRIEAARQLPAPAVPASEQIIEQKG